MSKPEQPARKELAELILEALRAGEVDESGWFEHAPSRGEASWRIDGLFDMEKVAALLDEKLNADETPTEAPDA